MDLNNKVIEVLNLKHGKKVKAFFEKHGVDVKNYEFQNTQLNNDMYRYYGLIDNKFLCYSRSQVIDRKAEIIRLPTKKSKMEQIHRRYFVQITKENLAILNRFLHKHWKNYKGYEDVWEVSAIGKYFCSESYVYIGERYSHSLNEYPALPGDELSTTHGFLSMLDIELLIEYLQSDNNKPITSHQLLTKSPDFSESELIVLKYLLDSNIKFDASDYRFYTGIFQLGYDFSTSHRVY